MEIFRKTYNGENFVDIRKDVLEAFDSDFNLSVTAIPLDEYGFRQGKFVVTIEWVHIASKTNV